MNRKLRSRYLSVILDARFIRLKRMLAELRRILTFKKRVVHVFLQLDDPYSYLLSHYLGPLLHCYPKVEFRFHICQALRGDFMPQPAMLAEYAVTECRLLAREFGVPFLDLGAAPAVEHRRAVLDYLADEHLDVNFFQTLSRALAVYWRGDTAGVPRLIGQLRPDPAATNVQVGKNQLLLRKLGHYNCATMFFAGEWYQGLERLRYLTDRLDRQGLNRFTDPLPELASLEQAMQVNLPATVPAKAAGLPPLEMFHSFRSPYSYIALARTFAIADAFGLRLHIRPVLPMVMRGLAVPQSKLLYIAQDANREAAGLGLPFGKISDSVGAGSERCIAAFYYALGQGKERAFLSVAGEAIWSRAIDVATDEGMQMVAKRAGLDWPELKQAMANEDWREKAEANREQLTEAGLWGVPSFKIGDRALWGQDRVWLLARTIENMCHGGSGTVQ